MAIQMTLGDAAARIFSGRMTSKLRPGADSLPVIGVRDVGERIAQLDQLELVEGVDGTDAERLSIQAGDVVITSRGALRSAVAELEHEGALAGVNTVVLRPIEPSTSIVLAAYLRHPTVVEHLLSDFAGSKIPGFSIETLRALPLSLPDVETLKRMEAMIQAAYEYHASITEAANARLALALELVARNIGPSSEGGK